MPVRRTEPANAPLPSPFPEGWYFVASRQALGKAKLVQKTWMGEDIVAWRDENGRVCVAEAYCPHLGSDRGPPQGGAYATAGSSVPSMVLSTTPVASALPRPLLPRRGPLGCESSRHGKSSA